MSIRTPWGEAQDSKRYAPGITFHETASHGGFHVDAAKLAEMPAALRAITPYAGEGWYEEDADWAIVALAFPDLFGDYDLHCAMRTVGSRWQGKESHPEAAEWLRSDPQGAALRARIVAWRLANGHLFEMESASTAGNGWSVSAWSVSATRIDRAERLRIEFNDREGVPLRSFERNGYYGLSSPFDERRIAELGGRVISREPLDTMIGVRDVPLTRAGGGDRHIAGSPNERAGELIAKYDTEDHEA